MINESDLKHLRVKLKAGEYDGADIMKAWIAIDELISIKEWREKAFLAHPNIDVDIEHVNNN